MADKIFAKIRFDLLRYSLILVMKNRGGKTFLIFILSVLVCSGFFIGENCQAAGEVVINEIAWMGSIDDANNEWLELKNLSDSQINLDNWTLKAADGSPAITLKGNISSGGYFLLERTDDNSTPKSADQIYSGAIGNSGETLQLINADGSLIDNVNMSDGWTAGDNTSKATAERCEDVWQTSIPNGTPGASNNCTEENPPAENNSSDSQNEVVIKENKTLTVEKTTGNEIFITEILPNPLGSDREAEFIELKNYSNKEINLAGWKIEIENGRSFVFGEFFATTTILRSGDRFVLWRKNSNLALENGGGVLRLFKPGGTKAIQTVEYGEALEGASWADTEEVGKEPTTATKDFFLNSLKIERWVWTYYPTPWWGNEFLVPNRPPQAKFFVGEKVATGTPIIFDASDSIDEDGDQLMFIWDFGDGVKLSGETVSHTFLNNGEYTVRLIASDGQNEMVFEKILNSLSFLEVKPKTEVLSSVVNNNNTAVNKQPISLDKKLVEILNPTEEKFISTAIAEIKNKSAGENISISDTVIVPPGVYGTQYFYIIDNKNQAVKIYNFKKDFPELKIGELIEINGQIMQNAQEKYIKIANQEDVKILGTSDLPTPLEKDIIEPDDLNKFITLQGDVAKKDGTRIFLENASGQASIYFKPGANIDKSVLKIGTQVKISGLVGIISQDLELLPRGQEDIFIVSTENQISTVTKEKTEFQTASGTDWILPERKKNNFIFYLLIIFGATILVLAGLLLKKRLTK
ncbi:MAG: lamin tail domain-containing protein [Patescibacteria group bacterium]|jgi:hypothetical protein